MYKIGWFFNVADVPHIEVIFDHQKAQMSTYFWVRGRLKIFQNDLSFGRCSFSSNDLTLFEQNLFWNLFRTSLFTDWFKLWFFWKYSNFCLTTITCSNRVLMHDADFYQYSSLFHYLVKIGRCNWNLLW